MTNRVHNPEMPVSSYTLKRCTNTSPMFRKPAIVLVVLFLLGSVTPMIPAAQDPIVVHQTGVKATGVDISVTNVSFSYTTGADEGQYRMFSSNHPIPGFNRPAELYVIDAVVEVPIYADITLSNSGTAASGTIDVTLKVLHNEYQQFEMVNVTQQMASLGGGSSNNIGFTFTPTYSGNHTLEVIGISAIADDNPNNDQRNRHFTVASHYFNCEDLSQWTTTNEWGTSMDTFLSEGSACHAGNGETSTYSPSTVSVLETPTFDMSDAVQNPLRTNGMSFWYTGSSSAGDSLKVYVQNAAGSNTELATLSGTVDQVFIDGASWQTFSVNNQGATSPLIPTPQTGFSPSTKFRFVMTTDAIGNDIGFWLDDIVIMYDQKVKPMEYAFTSSGVSTTGSLPDEWGAVSVSLTNTGNISDYVLPEVLGLPLDWEVYFAHTTGVSINDQTGVLLAPGESKIIQVKMKPDENASTGFEQMTFKGTSSQYTTVNTTLALQYQVLPDREPLIIQPATRPTCPPGYTCSFEVEVQNIGDATDVFDLTIDEAGLPSGWNVQLAWTQSSSILVRPDTPIMVAFSMSVASSAVPDTIGSFTFHAQSQNNSAKSHLLPISVSASMISEAYVGMTTIQSNQEWLIDAGEVITVDFTIWNNASRQDIFIMEVTHGTLGMWTVEQPSRPDAVINPGESTTFSVKITAPSTGQAGDQAPEITPSITSKRSGMTIVGDSFSGIEVQTISDLSITIVDAPSKLRPGAATMVLFEVVNNGNGPVRADIMALNLPMAWDSWMQVNGDNATNPVDLSAPYDLQNNATIAVYIYVPSEEAAGEIHSISISVSNADGLEDANNSDNILTFDTITASVRIPSLSGSLETQSAMVGGTVNVNATLTNIGNAMDDSILVIASYSASPPNPAILAFFTTGNGGSTKSLDEPISLVLGPNQSTVLNVDLILPDSLTLNTRIVVTFEVIAGIDPQMRHYELQYESLIIIDQQRLVSAVLSAPTNQTQPTGVGVPFFVNITSMSSQHEEIVLYATTPENWQMVCNGVLVETDGQNLSFTPGHITSQLVDIPCTLHRLGGPLEGRITFQISTTDGAITWQDSQVLSFDEQAQDSSSLGVETMAGGVAVLLGFLLVMVLLLRSRSSEEDMEFEIDKEFPPVDAAPGPPVSSGPPVSATEVSPPMQQVSTVHVASGEPPLPITGLPAGWSMEQWTHYGQQYLDQIEGQR